MSEALLQVQDLSISFGEVRALDAVDLTIGRGEIRCLAGENGSGKSTLVKVVSGVYTPSSGTVRIDGDAVEHHDPVAAIHAGVQVIYQDLSLFDHLSVADNIAVNVLLHGGSKLFHRGQARRIAAEQLERIGVDLPLDARVSTLSVANKQLVAIARALSMDARLLFMDEPTTALTTREVDRLLSIVHDLKQRGLSIVFISHKLDEVFEVADTITVFRDGRKVGDFTAGELDAASLSFHMTGREVSYTRYRRTPRDDDATRPPLLQLTGLTKEPHYRDVDLTVRPGDIVGLTGLLGAGRTELALSLFGLNRPERGEVRIDGAVTRIEAPWDAIDLGIALVPEDRGTQGLFNQMSTTRNVSSARLPSMRNGARLLDARRERRAAEHAVVEMDVNNKDVEAVVGKLSGGNAQKVVIGKWVGTGPRLLILDSPTVGIDIGSKADIYERIHALAAASTGVVLISDEPEEIVANCNRVAVMHEGDLIAHFDEADTADGGFRERLAHLISDPGSARTGATSPARGAAAAPAGAGGTAPTTRKESEQR